MTLLWIKSDPYADAYGPFWLNGVFYDVVPRGDCPADGVRRVSSVTVYAQMRSVKQFFAFDRDLSVETQRQIIHMDDDGGFFSADRAVFDGNAQQFFGVNVGHGGYLAA